MATVVAGGGGTTVVVAGGGAGQVKYCGIVTHIISFFFPCICCCPIDEHRSDEEAYIGVKTIICCLLLQAQTPSLNVLSANGVWCGAQ